MTFPVEKLPQENPGKQEDSNRRAYNNSEVAEYYASLNYLTPCEKLLFDQYLKTEMSILDLGVGGGRTTSYLSAIAARYVGVDCADEMIVNCRKKFPQLEFQVADAADLSRFSSSSFDAVLMAFNGMDYLVPAETRLRGLAEIHRVLKPEGVLLFSSHNPRAVLVRPSWNRKKIEAIAQGIAGTRKWMLGPATMLLVSTRVVGAWLRATTESVVRLLLRVPRRAFWNGDGYMVDPAHGGLLTHYAVPRRVIAEVAEQGFRILQLAGDDYPLHGGVYVTDWYYYVFQKENVTKSSACA
jgi:ubiquinone/menaquinone biosynthesis C-methylase UbiE